MKSTTRQREMNKIVYKGLGHKLTFGKYSFIVGRGDGSADVMPISKEVYDALKTIYKLPKDA